MIVQIVLAWIGVEVPAVGALHPINAFIILGLRRVAGRRPVAREEDGDELAAGPSRLQRPDTRYSGWLWAASPTR